MADSSSLQLQGESISSLVYDTDLNLAFALFWSFKNILRDTVVTLLPANLSLFPPVLLILCIVRVLLGMCVSASFV